MTQIINTQELHLNIKNKDIPLYGVNSNPYQHKWTTSRKAYADIYIDDAAIGCPLIQVEDYDKRCVDWLTVYKLILEWEQDKKKRWLDFKRK